MIKATIKKITVISTLRIFFTECSNSIISPFYHMKKRVNYDPNVIPISSPLWTIVFSATV